MSLTSRFFKKPWQNKHAKTRLAAVRDLDEPELLAALPEIAQHDPAASVRLAALQRINAESFWLDARLRESDGPILAAADRFLIRCVTETSSVDLVNERLSWAKRLTDQDLIKTLAVHAQERAIRAHALEQIQAQGFLGDCYATESDADLAAGILGRIEQLSTLERLHGKLRKQSKVKARAVQSRLQEIKAARGEIDLIAQSAQSLLDQIETLARGERIAEREALLETIRSKWSELETPPPDLERRYLSALEIVQSAIERPLAEDAAKHETPDTSPIEISVNEALKTVAATIRSQLRDRQSVPKPTQLLADWDRAWNDLERVGEGEETLKTEMRPILKELQQQVQDNTSRGTKPEESAQKKADSFDFKSTLDCLSSALESGDLASAAQHVQDIRRALKALSAKHRPSAVTGRLQRLDGRFRELRDYQHWSNNAHREELIERLEALPESGQHPDAISAVLKEARGEWKRLEALEILPGDKRKYAAPGGQWRRFQSAAQSAFDSAKPFFKKRQGVQEQTLAQLQRFIESGLTLSQQSDSEAKTLTATLRKSREAIRRLDELPPQSRGKAAADLRALMDAISQRLEHAFEQVELAKRRLISEARALANEGELKAAIDRAKGLQAEWKRIGQGRRKTDQQQWNEFRSHIDPLFDKLDGERKARNDAQQAIIAQLKQLCTTAEEIADLPEEQLESAQTRLQGLFTEWTAHSVRSTALTKRFEKARSRFGDRLDAFRARERQAAADALDLAAATLQQAFERRLEGNSVDLAELSLDPDALNAGLKAAAERVCDPSIDADALRSMADEQVEAAHQVAIEFEFLSGLDSPAQDKERRMNYQVQRLAARLSEGEAPQDLGSEVAQLLDRWHAALPLPPEAYQSLQRRIGKSQTVLQNMLGNA